MNILHGTWMPEATEEFVQPGSFYVWVETTEKFKAGKMPTPRGDRHPLQLPAAELAAFLQGEVGMKSNSLSAEMAPRYFLLPSAETGPLPSLELVRYLEQDNPETFTWQYWQVDCYPVTIRNKAGMPVSNVIKFLNELHFLALHNLADLQLGADLLFWYHYSQALRSIILRDHYIPALRYEGLGDMAKTKKKSAKSPKAKSTRSQRGEPETDYRLYPAWEIASEQYESLLERYVDYMPWVCGAGFTVLPERPEVHDRSLLLRHFSEYLLSDIVTHTALPASFDKKIADTLVRDCLMAPPNPYDRNSGWDLYEQWRGWCDRIRHTQTSVPFYLCFQLQDPAQPDDPWQLQFLVSPKQDPSLQISLMDYWRFKADRQQKLQKQLGDSFEHNLLLNLGYAARIYPKLWEGLETDQPTGIQLPIAAALDFLQEAAWVLENAGYKVIVPAWWTPQGRQRAKVRLRAKGKSSGAGGNDKAKSYFSMDRLVEYQYELAIGGQQVSEREWMDLVNAKSSLVQFRGQWMHLDQDKMQQMLEFWKTQQAENPELSLLDIMRMSADGEEDVELDFERDQTLAGMMARLKDKSKLDTIDDPEQFQGRLRDYQKRGVSWLYYLEQLGLNGCLADDMGLGKTVQVIARLVQEREQAAAEDLGPVPPTLLIAPTSVVGNWRREMHKFAPHLKAIVHHGGERAQDSKAFKAMARDNDLVITSFTLARKDSKLLVGVIWQRVVLDEAQNIKNPKAAQTKAILKLEAHHRLALTGTPVENRLLDLWSIFNFLNPGYLGKQAQFRKGFEIPIQKNNDRIQSNTLKKLVEPFILRRVKTDKTIIKDLPDKVEQKLYCNLTKEQASLYAATIKDVEEQLDTAEGIQRKGLILSTLLKLKQICNHPRQFLQDESDFTPERSHKLSRLAEMLTEILEAGDSALIFTQFTELADALEKYIRLTHHCKTYYIHGGTNRDKREQMIAEFQDPETDPSVFVLSLKAGGVGITLTKANHVFHFDRWWNPAVEDQATDRAFRIGQEKNVFVHKFVAIGTLEERIDAMIEDKKKLADAIVGSDESWLTELDNEAFKELIALNKSAILD